MNVIYATSASINKKGVVARAWYRKHSKMDTTEIKGMRIHITLLYNHDNQLLRLHGLASNCEVSFAGFFARHLYNQKQNKPTKIV